MTKPTQELIETKETSTFESLQIHMPPSGGRLWIGVYFKIEGREVRRRWDEGSNWLNKLPRELFRDCD